MTTTIQVEEAYGPGPTVNVILLGSTVCLSAADQSSASPLVPLTRNSDGTPVYSYERWIRVRFHGIFGRVRLLRFWATNYDLDPFWQITYGVEREYRNPIDGRSPAALNGLPLSDPGESAPNVMSRTSHLDFHTDPASTDYLTADNASDWLVLQSSWTGSSGPSQMQPVPLALSFKWREA